MATFNPVIRTKDKEFNSVYIRISHNSKADYIKTSMSVHKSGIKKGEIVDRTILANCYIMIKKYIERTNNINISGWTVQELKRFLLSDSDDIRSPNLQGCTSAGCAMTGGKIQRTAILFP
jgi:hypothetical protein